MKVQKVYVSQYEYCWIVLDNDYEPVEPIISFIKFLRNVDKSPCTIKGYAHSLKLYWDFLWVKNIDWKQITVSSLAEFVSWLRTRENEQNIIDIKQARSQRQGTTINVILGAISSFYRFHNQNGTTSVTITESSKLSSNRYKSLLHHVFKDKPAQRRIVSVKQFKSPPKTINDEQFYQLLENCTNYRDKFLVWLLYETGIRIGQALALRHEDLICWDNELHVKYRTDNLNKIRNKTHKPNVIQVSNSLISLYGEYVSTLDQNQLNEYVFINLTDYKPLEYSIAKKLFTTLSKKCGFYIRPHMLRHTHASDLLKAGWEMNLIQKRLGHVSVQTTIDTYTHIDNDFMKKAFKDYLASKEKGQ